MHVIINLAITISSLFYLYFLFNIMLVNHYREPTTTPQKGQQPMRLYLIIPVLNEAAIIQKTITQLSAQLDQLPKTIQAQIIAVDDNSTDRSLSELAQTDSPYLQVLHRAGNEKQGKGAVLNTAIQYLQHTLAKDADPEQTIVGVLDADAFMTSQDLTAVVANFEQQPKIAMLQTGVSIYNQPNWLTRMQNFEFMCVNSATQQLRNRLGQGIASGNGQFVRLSLALVNPWGDRLLEDLEFTLRTWLLGRQVRFTHTIVVQQEGVEKLRPFFKQRVRWCQGAVQCMHYLPALWRSKNLNWFQRIDTTFWILMPITGCIVPVTSLVTLITLIMRSLQDWVTGWHHVALITVILIALFACLILTILFQRNSADAQQATKFWPALWDSISFQGYLLIIGLTPYAAIARQLGGQTNWTKTRHGAGRAYAGLKRQGA
ncbi:glycosyltransferase family 2 protein [Lactiplantibacillus dongliensis]|uniref:Glycosyltransferase family 2 protein n=1 Tax=Lactiplantibacillus dongliensis TaxID=2559919 RepID=A0ABW1RA89_9LACO|nr:glycosyltransferase family 2 protein [Lactiplantibacillus dongliensis]